MFGTIELVAVGVAGVLILGAFARYKWVMRKNKQLKARAASAELHVEHEEKIDEVTAERQKQAPERIKEKLNESVDNEFADFYGDND
jgi:hypothetical protein